ncbi:MAG TPA: sulfatase-like hydrolase/transferase, partial [Blastocatellia bacterium]|nr:sulfatase-like hydrolase/transferase [Blastocatellia bacterium]
VAFTFVNFDKDQNLKTKLFSRTTQAKQYFNLGRWVLDFDRDGYSRFLGGGDCDDRRADINPGCAEIVDAGVDHNCIGGPLTQQAIADWHLEYSSLHRPADASARRLNVIYIFIDALRADHLSVYGYARNTSPNLDKLAARSSLFENAFTPAPNTFEAMPKFTQGAYWDDHLESWPSIMARNGYDALLFPRRTSTIKRYVKGLRVVKKAPQDTFENTINAAIELFGNMPKDRPFCAYFYSNDPHRPYRPHSEFDYGSSITDLYDGEISYMDFHLGRLFDWMDSSGRMDDTVVVIMSDHGESLGERGVYKHSTLLYNEQTRVPMIIHVPGLPARSIKDYVSTIDLGPTMLNAVGLDYPKECAGVSLIPLMRGEPFTHPPVYGEQTQKPVPVRAAQSAHESRTKKYMIITQDGFKLIYNRDYASFELFDLRNDPSEIHNLYERMPEKAAELTKGVGRYIDVLTVSRPLDADESQFSRGPTGEVREAK